MKLHNVRLGLATNSSSSHSIVLAPEGRMPSTDEDREFGWSHFTVADPEAKENYLALTLRGALQRELGWQSPYVDIVLAHVFAHRGPGFVKEIDSGYVDHQSVLTLPHGWNEAGVDLPFFEALRRYLMHSNAVVLGGNDNDDSTHHLSGWPEADIPLPTDADAKGLIVRDDGTHWVLFNRHTGAKVRFSLGRLDPITKGAAPELVDIKITDYCPFGCAYCYQASTLQGKHADRNTLQSLAYELAEMKVFEVAIGGGEPTLHPDFTDILRSFRYNKVIPNFTTRNVAWLRDAKQRAEILTHAGAFAFSVDRREDVTKLHDALESVPDRKDDRFKASVQYVVESGGDVYGVLDEAAKHGYRVTLLGFKETGFGKGYTRTPEDWIAAIAQVREKHEWRVSVGVDTAIVAEHQAALVKQLGIKPVLMTAEEGKYSMYVDAVNKRVGPSSYCAESDYRTLAKLNRESLLSAFRQW